MVESESDNSWMSDPDVLEDPATEPEPEVQPPTKRRKVAVEGKKAQKKKKGAPRKDGKDPNFDASKHQLPREMVQNTADLEYDIEDEGDTDHVNYWRLEDTDALVSAINHNRKALKGNFEGSGGGKIKRDKAWVEVAGKH